MITAGSYKGPFHAAAERLGFGRTATATAGGGPSLRESHRNRLAPAWTVQPRRERDIALACILLILALSSFVPGLRLFVTNPSDRVAVSTATTVVCVLAGVLFLARFLQTQRLRALLIACALGFITGSSLFAQALMAGHVELMGHSASWVALAGRLTGWLFVLVAAFVPDQLVTRGGARVLGTRARAIRSVVVSGLALFALGLGLYVTMVDPVHRGPVQDPGAELVVQSMIALIASVAAWVFVRERRHNDDPGLRLLSLAAMFGAGASIAYCAYTTIPLTYVGMGDVLRLGSGVVLLASVCVEWYVSERRFRDDALTLEHSRIAADVHDLIMQDLSLALSLARSISDEPGHREEASTIVAAGERALAGAREVVDGLKSQDSTPIVEAVGGAVAAAARDAKVSFDGASVPTDTQPDPLTQDSLVHIAREAVTNAAKHAKPPVIEVVLEYGDEWRLMVRDEGRGFDPSAEDERGEMTGMGFGLESMHQRAQALGGSLSVTSAPGSGTIVEAVLP